jgi:hypothetical protein
VPSNRSPMSRGTGIRLWLAVGAAILAAAPFAPARADALGGAGDVTVIAVIDSGFSPYHWDFAASKMPQATNKDRSDDLPLSRPPDTWIPEFPSRNTFSRYAPLNLSLDQRDPDAEQAALHDKDQQVWDGVRESGPDTVNYYWIPGTKVVGALSFGPETAPAQAGHLVSNPYYGDYAPIYGGYGPSEHGMGSASVAVGNGHGTCPECVLVFLQYSDNASANRAIDWAMNQPWIDGISNSYLCDTVPETGLVRDSVCLDAHTAVQRKASLRGQTIFWAAGNGVENTFVTPNETLLHAQKGPDWIVTVTGATFDGKAAYTGAGKPADIAGVARNYSSAYQSTLVTGGLPFSGTSNATPEIAGIYGRALYLVRRYLPGASKTQSNGTIAMGKRTCASAWRSCELADGRLTATELRLRLLQSAPHRIAGGAVGPFTTIPEVGDDTFAYEGHGTYLGRATLDDRKWLAEFDLVLLPLTGRARPPRRPPGEREWMVVDSWCRQRIWGDWTGGYYVAGKTALPLPDAAGAPIRTTYQTMCSTLPRLADPRTG